MIGWIILLVVVAVAGYAICLYNDLVRNRQLTKEGWSGIDVQLKRRTDLIPNLLETREGLHGPRARDARGRGQARAAATVGRQRQSRRSAPSSKAQLSGALGKLLAIAEAYPDLKANTTFLEFQEALQTVEDEIQMSRRYYNGAVRNLNVAVESFPSVLIANAFKFEKAEYFELENEADRAVPDREVLAPRRAADQPECWFASQLARRAPRASPSSSSRRSRGEEIRSFTPPSPCGPTAAVDVTETIEVNAEGVEIRRGIFRDIPTTLTQRRTARACARTSTSSRSRATAEPSRTASSASTTAPASASAMPTCFLNHGVHRYVIRYTMTRMVRGSSTTTTSSTGTPPATSGTSRSCARAPRSRCPTAR